MPKPTHKKKPFIDKKHAVSFQLIHRSQQDPLAADEDAPQMLLQPLTNSRQDRDKIKEQERQFGVFYEDDYNYLQHLKDRTVVEHDWSAADRFVIEKESSRREIKSERAVEEVEDELEEDDERVRVGNLSLPSRVFASKVEEEVGLLNKAAPRGLDLSLDPDIVAAMDDDFDFEDPDNELDDDFVMQAMGGEERDSGEEEDGEWETDSDQMGGGRSDDENDDEVPELQTWDEEETKTKFTNYSMSSSVIRRNKELTLLDDKFEKFMDQYGEMEEGALDADDIEGTLAEDGERMLQLVKESEEERATERQNIEKEQEAARRLLIRLQESEDEETEAVVVETPKERWDCESVLSTYSNLYNHPKLISERRPEKIQLSSKTGLPKDTLGRGGLTAAALRQLDRDNSRLYQQEDEEEEEDVRTVASRVSVLSIRNKHETLEEKKARKTALKEFRRERRQERKANTLAFKEEKGRQEKILINNRNNLQGVKIL